jgi:hypothetical protein
VELRGRESWPIILPKCTTSTEHLVIFYMPLVYDMGPTAVLPLRRKALKNPTASAGFEPANLGTKGQHATPRPPKTLIDTLLRCVSGGLGKTTKTSGQAKSQLGLKPGNFRIQIRKTLPLEPAYSVIRPSPPESRKAPVIFGMSVCPSFRPHVSNRFPSEGSASNLIQQTFMNICRENQ